MHYVVGTNTLHQEKIRSSHMNLNQALGLTRYSYRILILFDLNSCIDRPTTRACLTSAVHQAQHLDDRQTVLHHYF